MTDKQELVAAAIQAFNDAHPPCADSRDNERARLPILATDCDYEIVRFSGVQGMRI